MYANVTQVTVRSACNVFVMEWRQVGFVSVVHPSPTQYGMNTCVSVLVGTLKSMVDVFLTEVDQEVLVRHPVEWEATLMPIIGSVWHALMAA